MKQPKEITKELVDKFEDELGHSDLNVCYTGDLDKETTITAKRCALICCDEIIKVLPKKAYIGTITDHELMKNPKITYWQAVKKELKK